MKASDLLAHLLVGHGVTHIFEMIGGMTTHLIDSIAADGRIEIVSMHHEQGAAFAVDGHARICGIPAVAMATSGPGATNLLTGIGSCFFDSVPAVFITGQVNRHEMKGDRAIRQLGFQETDIVAMAKPITKAAWCVSDPTRLADMVIAAFALAASGRPGPVLIDIPMDVQCATVAAAVVPPPPQPCPLPVVEGVWERVGSARRPLILAGGGIASGRARDRLRACLLHARIPVVHSLMGVDVLPAGHPSRAGLIGSYGNRWANLAISEADLLLVLGSRLDVRQTGSNPASFHGGKTIVHVDCEPAEVNNRVTGCVPVIADLTAFLEASRLHLGRAPLAATAEWFARIEQLRQSHPDVGEARTPEGSINPNAFIRRLSWACREAATVCVDVGQHQMWAAQSWQPGEHQRFLTSGGMGSMGFALPAAVGAACALRGSDVIVIAGDGGFQCNIQELQTIRRRNLPIKMVVLNNRCHGMVRQFQESYFKGRYQSTLIGYSAPDFARVAAAYGIPSRAMAAPHETDAALAWLAQTPGPALLEVAIAPEANVYPKLAFGRPFPAMEPDVQPTEMEGT